MFTLFTNNVAMTFALSRFKLRKQCCFFFLLNYNGYGKTNLGNIHTRIKAVICLARRRRAVVNYNNKNWFILHIEPYSSVIMCH